MQKFTKRMMIKGLVMTLFCMYAVIALAVPDMKRVERFSFLRPQVWVPREAPVNVHGIANTTYYFDEKVHQISDNAIEVSTKVLKEVEVQPIEHEKKTGLIKKFTNAFSKNKQAPIQEELKTTEVAKVTEIPEVTKVKETHSTIKKSTVEPIQKVVEVTEVKKTLDSSSTVLVDKVATVSTTALKNVSSKSDVQSVLEPTFEKRKAAEAKEECVLTEQPCTCEETEENQVYWIEMDQETGNIKTSPMSKEKFIAFYKQQKVAEQVNKSAMSFIYGIRMLLEKGAQTILLGSVATAICVVVEFILRNAGVIALSNILFLGFSPLVFLMPAVALLGLFIKGYKKRKGDILTIMAIICLISIKTIPNGSLAYFLIDNGAIVLGLIGVCVLYAMEYASRTKHDSMFPVDRKKRTSIIATTVSLIAISAVLICSLLDAQTGVAALTKTFFVMPPAFFTQIMLVSMAVLAYTSSVFIGNLRAEKMESEDRTRLLMRVAHIGLGLLATAGLLALHTMTGFSPVILECARATLVLVIFGITTQRLSRHFSKNSPINRYREFIFISFGTIALILVLTMITFIIGQHFNLFTYLPDFSGVQHVLESVWNSITGFFATIAHKIGDGFSWVGDHIMAVIHKIIDAISGLFNGSKEVVN
ncbi:hypothetical protein NEOKW01_0258 [Nematocida sp. AWRm80]|nr:hypothetical protein NEOKW01_0258 [Nematocida sp. AWRm80]